MKSDHLSECIMLPPSEQRKCHQMAYVCPLEKCIPFTYVCDGILHCSDGAGEMCNNIGVTSHVKDVDIYECPSGGNLLMKYVDDLIPDCINATDEAEYGNILVDDTPIGMLCL